MIEESFWIFAVSCWCMSFYVLFSSGEGLGWFLTFKNYQLILGALSGLAFSRFSRIPSKALMIVFFGWSLYAFLVTSRYWRYQLWRRHLFPVTGPLVCIAGFDILRQFYSK